MHSTPKGLLCATLTACLPLALLSGCSSDSNSDPEIISALTAPEGVSVVDADDSEIATGGGFPNAGNQFPVDSPYVQDVASIQVFDPSIRAVENANGILCEIAHTRFWKFVNQPAYVSQLDTALCGQQPDVSEGDSVSTDIHVFTMEVSRASNASPQVGHLWLPLENEGNESLINATLNVTEAPSQADRFGAFELTFAAVPDGGTVQDPAFYGVLQSADGETGFRFLEGAGDVTVPAANPGDQKELKQIALSQTGGQGAAKVVLTSRYNRGSGDTTETVTWRVVFDDTHVLRQRDSDTPVALNRATYRNHVYSYNMYHNSGNDMGERVALNAGIGVELPSGEYGWVGYHGAWAPPGQSFVHGSTVVDQNTNTAYTVVQAPGRLKRYERDQLLLTEIGTQRFEWWDSGNRWQVAYSGVEWQQVAQYNFSTQSWDELGSPVMIDTSTIGFLGMWSPFLGQVNYVHGDASITFFVSALVTGSDPIFANGALDLFATVDGLKGEISQVEVDTGDIYVSSPAMPSDAEKYVIDPADMTLMHDVNGDGTLMEQVGLATGVVPTAGPNQWGMQSGPMVFASDLGSMSSIYDIFSETTFYVYETGHNPWNQFIGLVDSMNAFVTFDAPIEFLYTHDQTDDMNDDATYDGQQIMLSYNGPGKLWGIPGEEIDLGGGENRYLPNFSLKDGTIVGPTGAEYIVRAIGVEQTLDIDPLGAPQLNIADADALTIPDTSLYETPIIGEQPEVEGPPAVIDGVIQ